MLYAVTSSVILCVLIPWSSTDSLRLWSSALSPLYALTQSMVLCALTRSVVLCALTQWSSTDSLRLLSSALSPLYAITQSVGGT